MPDTEPAENEDHDQRLKALLKEFFEQFFLCFLAYWADRLDFSDVTWLDKEVFLTPPKGKKRQPDLVAKVRLKPDAPPPHPEFKELVTLVHIEVESGESVSGLRPRMFEYYTQLRRDLGLPVLPIGVFLRVGLKGCGWDVYEEQFWGHPVLRFEFAYVGLPALDAEEYVNGKHLLGVALSALMKAPPEHRVELHAKSLNRISRSGDNDIRKYLLTECLEAYGQLSDAQRKELASLMETEPYREAKPYMITTYERGKIEALRETALMQLDARFGPLSSELQQRVSELNLAQLQTLLTQFARANHLDDIRILNKSNH